ncbi:MAG: magnesium/cobalt transporter CorA [Planctomycetia bacterium]|nr:magnesium/cobalt transporter CorA [Planctomycetia bacterium]
MKLQILCRSAGSAQPSIITEAALIEALSNNDSTLWIDIVFGTEDVAATTTFLNRYFTFHPLALEDALLETHLARVDDWQKYLYIAFHVMMYRNHAVHQQELDIFLGANYLVTIHSEEIETLQKLWDQLQKNSDQRQMQTPDRLLYHLFDKLTNTSMQTADCLDDALDEIEQQIFSRPQRGQLGELFRLRRVVLQMRRMFGNQREAMNRLARDIFGVIHPENRVYFRDIYDHLVRMHELSDGLRDMASSALESHISVTSYRMNEVMKTLTVVTVLFMPLTFLTGYFGMNFFGDQFNIDNPWSHYFWFIVCMLLMVITPIAMLYWMKRRGWLNSSLQPERQDLHSDHKT